MHDVILSKAITFVILKANYVVISVNEVTIVDPQKWMNIHIYVI
jgi:hypothetical protein